MGWIRIRMDPELLPGSGRAGSGSGINHSGSTKLLLSVNVRKEKPYLQDFKMQRQFWKNNHC